tara:strand:- start:25305 stop:25694 length:390 start_codon:yes stop_codon:yes gene_type:complete
MKILEWYFGFHAPLPLRDVRSLETFCMAFGHVEAWGYTMDDTWMFFDPRRGGTMIRVTHLHDEVNAMLVARLELCERVLKFTPDDRTLRFPPVFPMNCAQQCGHLVGMRAFSLGGLARMLLRNGAEQVK